VRSTPDRPGAVFASFPVACRFGRTTATAGFCAPTQTRPPRRKICPTLRNVTRRTANRHLRYWERQRTYRLFRRSQSTTRECRGRNQIAYVGSTSRKRGEGVALL
jgi:hypothetical protein